jgi:hypothetical protein
MVPPSPSFLKKNWGWAESEEVSRVNFPRWEKFTFLKAILPSSNRGHRTVLGNLGKLGNLEEFEESL